MIVFAAAFVLTLAGFVKAIYVSLDIDESYLVACAYRLSAGDRLFADMWEPHQLASLIPSLFVRAYLAARGSAEGIVIFLRITGALIHLAIGVILYAFAKKRTKPDIALWVFLIHLNFLPKWVQSLDFELMAYQAVLGSCMLLISLCDELSGERRRYKVYVKYFAAGLLLLISMLSYPTLILLYPVFLAGIMICHGRDMRAAGASFFTAGALIPGLIVLFIIFRSVPSGKFIDSILNVFTNPSHATQSFGKRMAEYAAEGLRALALWAVITAAAYLVIIICRKGKKSGEDLVLSMALTFIILQAVMILGCIFLDKNQFFMQGRYAALIVPAVMVSLKHREKYGKLVWLAFIPGVLSVLSVMTVTNMNAGTAWSKAMPAVLAAVYVLASEFSGEGDRLKGYTCFLAFGALLAGLFLCRLGLLRVTGCLPVTIKADLERVSEGPAKGIFITKPFADAANREYEALRGLYNAEDNVLYVGAEMLLYLDYPCRIASPSVEGTTIYDEYFLRYYDEHPERLPDYVVYDRHYSEVYEYRRYPQEYVIDEWISDNYPNVLLETPDLTVYVK